MLQKLWYDRPVRTQLLIAIGAINLIAALLAGVISIINTRSATRVDNRSLSRNCSALRHRDHEGSRSPRSPRPA